MEKVKTAQEPKLKKHLLGQGELNWYRDERISDRYGFVHLCSNGKYQNFRNKGFAGKSGKLIAVIVETKESSHIGDFFRGVGPSTPEKGELVALGEGRLVFKLDIEDSIEQVGLQPEDGRPDNWLDIQALYRCHEQTVNLFFEEAEDATGIVD